MKNVPINAAISHPAYHDLRKIARPGVPIAHKTSDSVRSTREGAKNKRGDTQTDRELTRAP